MSSGGGRLQPQVADESDQLAGHAAYREKRVGLALQPMTGDRRGQPSLVALDNPENCVVVGRATPFRRNWC